MKRAHGDKNVVVIIQARTGSTRLPEKVLVDIEGKPMLWHVIERVKRCETVDVIVVATTEKDEDDNIAGIARGCGVECFRGSEHDVLERYYLAARQFGADIIVRVTADCPLIDPRRIDEVVAVLIENDYDYINPDRRFSGLPRGIRAEPFTFRALEKSHKHAQTPSEREHVVLFMRSNNEFFKHGWLEVRNFTRHLQRRISD